MEINSRILECVPNFSEGRDSNKINKIVDAIRSVEGVAVLHTDIGFDANRTVITFAGVPEAVAEAAYKAVSKAAELIDMSSQTGVHPRIGATDVLPLVPVSGISMEETIELAKKLAEKIGTELQIPVYCYEKSAQHAYRQRLESIRHGEYEGLTEKLMNPLWIPDFGPTKLNKQAGATVLGARSFLVAYNVNLETPSIEIARKIAGIVRESGYSNIVNGEKMHHAGLLKTVKAIGWRMDEYNKVQVSMNITDIDSTSVHEAFETVKKVAVDFGTCVTGSELIGLIPLKALLDAGKYYSNNETLNQTEYIQLAIKKMGLNELSPFDYKERILEYKLSQFIEIQGIKLA